MRATGNQPANFSPQEPPLPLLYNPGYHSKPVGTLHKLEGLLHDRQDLFSALSLCSLIIWQVTTTCHQDPRVRVP